MLPHETYLHRCLKLAAQGLGKTAPNPMVGCVIVHEGKVIGEGFHREYGKAHAEVEAIESVADETLLKKSTLYVNLEPCAHHGKTPPCADLIIEKGIPKVVISSEDVFEEVAGEGIRKMKEAGIEVECGVMEEEALELNKRFFTFHQQHRPYIILKWAQTLDGFIDRERNAEDKGINWITEHPSQILVHRWRSEEQAIMVGTRTAEVDDPSLTTREFHGENPLRIIVNRSLRLSQDLKIFNRDAPTLLFTENQAPPTHEHAEFIALKTGEALPQVLHELYQRDIQSLIVEGGSLLINSFVEAGLWDEARVLVGQKTFGKGKHAPLLETTHRSFEYAGKDKVLYYRNEKLES